MNIKDLREVAEDISCWAFCWSLIPYGDRNNEAAIYVGLSSVPNDPEFYQQCLEETPEWVNEYQDCPIKYLDWLPWSCNDTEVEDFYEMDDEGVDINGRSRYYCELHGADGTWVSCYFSACKSEIVML